MTFQRFKRNVFFLEGLNGLGCSLYFNYLFFYLSAQFKFGNAGNLLFCAINGFLYIFGSLYGGRFAQRKGYLTALAVGNVIVTLAMLVAFFSSTMPLHLLALVIWTCGICFTWPSLEALSCEGESAQTLPRKVGIYNVVWSSTLAVGYFFGGAIINKFGSGSIFLIPAILHGAQILMALKLRKVGSLHALPGCPQLASEVATAHEARAKGKAFLRMAWLANPFAYIAMNTVVPMMPDIASRLQLSQSAAGFFGSVWMFARMFSFALLWKWTGWHYKFRWMLGAYLLLIVTFAALLLLSNLWILVAVQILFGAAVGLIYYSSLFYSMDASDAKGEHGGVHEAAIGAGIFLGPAIGFGAIHFFPANPASSAYAVSAALAVGLGGLLYLKRR